MRRSLAGGNPGVLNEVAKLFGGELLTLRRQLTPQVAEKLECELAREYNARTSKVSLDALV